MDPVLISGELQKPLRTEAEARADAAKRLAPYVPEDHDAPAYLYDPNYLSDDEAHESLERARRTERSVLLGALLVLALMLAFLIWFLETGL